MTKTKTSQKVYHDGPDEDWLYEQIVVKKRKDFEQIIQERNTWPVRYHLSEQRKHLLMPIEFSGTTLEVGAGCGGITGILLEKSKKVVSIELTQQRRDILASRYDNAKNLEVISSNIMEYNPKVKFDNVVVVGVWEYSGKYVKGDDPYLEFLKKCYSLLKPTGKLILAIENKLGIKYLSGAPEDHTGQIFSGIEDYIGVEGIRTFSKKEIDNYLEKVGFKQTEYYYPFPDYKMPTDIFTDWSIENMNFLSNRVFPTPINDINYKRIFTEALFFENLKREGIADRFVNSFLIIANRNNISELQIQENLLFSRFISWKKNEENSNTRIFKLDSDIYIQKSAMYEKDVNNDEFERKIKKAFKFPEIKNNKIELIKGDNLSYLATSYLVNRNENFVKQMFKDLKNRLESGFGSKLDYFIDLNLSNLILKNNDWYIIDYEVFRDIVDVSIDIVIYRALTDFYNQNFLYIFKLYTNISCFTDFIDYYFVEYSSLKEEFVKLEISINSIVSKNDLLISDINNLYPKRDDYEKMQEIYNNLIEKHKILEQEKTTVINQNENLLKDNAELNHLINQLKSENTKSQSYINHLEQSIESSRALKISRKIKKIIKK